MMIAERITRNWPVTRSELVLDRVHLADVRILAGEQFAPLIDRFCDNAAAQIEALRAALLANDVENMRRNAHKLRGSGLVIGARALAHHAGELEEKIYRNEMRDFPEAVDAIAACYRELVELLKKIIAQI